MTLIGSHTLPVKLFGVLLPEFPEILIWYYELRYSATWYYRHAGLVKKVKVDHTRLPSVGFRS